MTNKYTNATAIESLGLSAKPQVGDHAQYMERSTVVGLDRFDVERIDPSAFRLIRRGTTEITQGDA